MLSPCLFIVLLAIGYFFIDKKTQTELINKCKQNKFMILGGIVFIYYFFLRNRIEGLSSDDPEYYTKSILKICYASNIKSKDSLLYSLNNILVDKGHKKLSDNNHTQCFLDGITRARQSEIRPHLKYKGETLFVE